ncbi:MAG TPA: hypothetical protein VJS37_10670 [Terriglobales bacterium]|nr:hypothetical protein [Terriglobales bacterium]
MNPDGFDSKAERAEFLAPFNPNHRHDFHLLVRPRDAFELGDSRSSASYRDILPAFEPVLLKLKSALPKYHRVACPACRRCHPLLKIEVWYYVMTDSEVIFERHCDVLSIKHAIARLESGIAKLKELAEMEQKYCSLCGRLQKQL